MRPFVIFKVIVNINNDLEIYKYARRMKTLKPSHIGNSHNVQFKAVFDVKLLAMALDQYL